MYLYNMYNNMDGRATMIAQFTILMLLLFMPYEITATHEVDHEAIAKEFSLLERETRAWRQQRSGHGL